VLLASVAILDNLTALVATAGLDAGRMDPRIALWALAALVALALLSRWRRAPFFFYAVGFFAVWAFTLKSGLDPALAGLACALTVPIGARRPGQESTIKYFMESLHPYVAFAVLPLFVFTEAGVALKGLRAGDLAQPQPLAIMLALVVGKPLGVFGAYAGAVWLKIARRPMGVDWRQALGVAMLCGVGFSVSYFLAGMGGAEPSAPARAAVLLGSIASALVGGTLVARAETRRLIAEPRMA
ncbi:MAG: Na+/H+ antiporter NhaA, partial [Caulobacteraceae bacterium]